MDGNGLRGFNSKTHPISTYFHYENRNVIIDYNTFIDPSGENQHGYPFLSNGVTLMPYAPSSIELRKQSCL